jgi:cytochrome c oxidase assembly protein subunit 11
MSKILVFQVWTIYTVFPRRVRRCAGQRCESERRAGCTVPTAVSVPSPLVMQARVCCSGTSRVLLEAFSSAAGQAGGRSGVRGLAGCCRSGPAGLRNLAPVTSKSQASAGVARRCASSASQGPGRRRVGASRSAEREAAIRERNKSFAAWMLAIAMGTVGLSYASVPLYRVFCQVTGFGGTVRRADGETDEFETALDDVEIVPGRPITVRFNADVSARVPWRFTPSQAAVTVLPGETALAFYVAENLSNVPVNGISTYNVTPAKAGMYFNKIQCFCFDEQRLKPGEALDMPVFFYLDPSLVEDDAMSDVNDITLSYTFFRAEDVSPEQLQQAQAAAMGH